ncbi:MAG: diguanylate cyclase [Alphaproteobacteria bacterium]|nr:diguanylate cyclase [Alphaproteobacteria bacterium]
MSDAARDDTGPDPLTETARLIEQGALADHPGPVMLVDREGIVRARNVPALPFAFKLHAGELPALAAIIDAVIGGTGAQVVKLSDEESGGTIDFSATPITDRAGVLLIGRDVSLDQNLRSALVDSRQRYKDLVEISSDFAWETGPVGTFSFVSAAGALGYEPDELVGRPADSFLTTPEGMAMTSPFTTQHPIEGVETLFRRADGSVATLEAAASPLLDADGVWHGARGVCRDVTEARLRDAALAQARNRERLTSYIVRTIHDEIEPNRMLDAAAHALVRATAADGCALLRIVPGSGLVPVVMVGELLPAVALDPIREPVTERDEPVTVDTDVGLLLGHRLSYQGNMNGAVVLWRSTGSAGWDDEECRLLGEVADQLGIALRQVDAHEHLRMLSSTDAMTGLLNRRAFQDALQARLATAGRGPGTLVYVDLDNFKQVNDRRGHQTGDRALIHLAEILRDQAGPKDLVARLGGDEFALWMQRTGHDSAPQRAERILAAGAALREYSGSPDHPVGLSIGMAVAEPGSPEPMQALIERADAVMYEIKHSGKGWYRIATPPTRDDRAP